MTTQTGQGLKDAFSYVTRNYQGTEVDLHALYARCRRENPVMVGDMMADLGVPSVAGRDPNRPAFTLFKHADVMNLLRDSTGFTSGFIAEGLGSFFDGLILTGMDGDTHRRARGLLQPAFMPDAVNRWRDRMNHVIRAEYVEPLRERGRADLIADVGLHFPVRIIYSLLGFPEDDQEAIERYANLALAILAGPQVDPEKAKSARQGALAAAQALYDALLPVVGERRASGAQGDDLISRLINAEFEGGRLDDHQITTFVRSLLPAAAETTTRTFGTLMTLLLERPELLARLRRDRSVFTKAFDESIRFEPTATFKVRQAARDTAIRGVPIPAGALVAGIVTSANRDEDVFADADRYDIDRKQVPSFGFGFGPHMCIGQFVAKTEIRCALDAILDLWPNVRLDPDAPPPRIVGAMLRGPQAVHVIWD